MKRKIYSELLKWKSKGGKTALLIEGARRIGKSYIALEFARNEYEYESYIFIDFSKTTTKVRNLFKNHLEDLDTFFELLHPTEVYEKILIGKLEVNLGMIAENLVAQMLTVAKHKLYFYNNPDRLDTSSRMEIDFLIRKGNITSRHNIIPIEVKSSTGYTTKSLEKCVNKFGEYVTQPTVLHCSDMKNDKGLLYLPLYMSELM